MAISEFLLSILICPLSKAPLVLDGNRLISTDPKTRRAYRVEDDIPIMLIDESEELDEATWRAIMERVGPKAVAADAAADASSDASDSGDGDKPKKGRKKKSEDSEA